MTYEKIKLLENLTTIPFSIISNNCCQFQQLGQTKFDYTEVIRFQHRNFFYRTSVIKSSLFDYIIVSAKPTAVIFRNFSLNSATFQKLKPPTTIYVIKKIWLNISKLKLNLQIWGLAKAIQEPMEAGVPQCRIFINQLLEHVPGCSLLAKNFILHWIGL